MCSFVRLSLSQEKSCYLHDDRLEVLINAGLLGIMGTAIAYTSPKRTRNGQNRIRSLSEAYNFFLSYNSRTRESTLSTKRRNNDTANHNHQLKAPPGKRAPCLSLPSSLTHLILSLFFMHYALRPSVLHTLSSSSKCHPTRFIIIFFSPSPARLPHLRDPLKNPHSPSFPNTSTPKFCKVNRFLRKNGTVKHALESRNVCWPKNYSDFCVCQHSVFGGGDDDE